LTGRAWIGYEGSMSAPREPGPPSTGSLDLERADFGDTALAPLACAKCAVPITSSYYTFDDDVLCHPCRARVEAALDGGSPVGRFLGATLLGVVAAALGAAVWLAVTRFTGYEIGLIAIVVGFLVGTGVLLGSRQRGGVPYQLLAVFLTYTAICATYVPAILQAAQERGGVDAPVPGVPALAFAMGIAYALPFLAGFQNVIGILIIGFALWQAWTMNRRRDLGVAGPFEVGATSTRS
jgi:hypothetical protein